MALSAPRCESASETLTLAENSPDLIARYDRLGEFLERIQDTQRTSGDQP